MFVNSLGGLKGGGGGSKDSGGRHFID